MARFNPVRCATVVAVVAVVVPPTATGAQERATSQTLVVPTVAIGRCSAAAALPAFRGNATGLRGVRLVVDADHASRRRELALFLNALGQPVEYDEQNYGPTLNAGAAEEVVWATDGAGVVQAFRLKHTRLAPTVEHTSDRARSAGLRHERFLLSASELAKVHAMIAWMRAQCATI